jgi:hypothetical protein
MRTRLGRERRHLRNGGSWLALVLLLGACSGGNEAKPEPTGQTGGAPVSAGPVELTGSEHISDPEIAIDGEGTIHVVWVEGLTSEAHVVHRFLRKGQDWSAPVTLSEGYQYNGEPALLTKPDGQVCAFWKATVPEAALYMRCWTNGSWSPTEKAVDPQGLTAEYAPSFAPDGSPLALYGNSSNLIAFAGAPLTANGVSAASPTFAVDASGGYHAAWLQFANQTNELGGLVYRHSGDGGTTWDEPELLNEPQDIDFDQELVADKQGNVHWVSLDGTYRRWTRQDGWGDVARIDAAGLGHARLAVDAQGRARIVRPGTDGVYLAEQRTDGSWTEPALVTSTAGGPVDATSLAIDETGGLHLVWLTTGDNPVLFYAALG